MTVCRITSARYYAGYSTDTKPADATEGSTFHCVDTGDVFVLHNGMWIPDLRAVAALRAI